MRQEAEAAEAWYYDQLEKQSDRASYEDPVLTLASIAARRQQLTTATSPIMVSAVLADLPISESRKSLQLHWYLE